MHHFHLSHSDYYRDRHSVSELCYDFPGDEILVRGLDAMQMHFANNRSNIEIPVLRVMNAAHYLAAYMLETTCSGDQTEYDTLAYASVGRDKQLTFLTMIVLAAMLKRTEGFRARNCRNLILENRSEDFDEGVTLYERFLQSSEKHFAEEDFLIDIPRINEQLREKNKIIALQSQQIENLENTITAMEEKYQQINIGTQYKQDNNQGTIYNSPVTINKYYGQQDKYSPTEDCNSESKDPAKTTIPFFKYIHPCVTKESEKHQIHEEIQNLVRSLPLPEICRYLRQMYKDKRVYLNVKTEAMFDELHRMGMPDESVQGFSQKNFQNYFNTND